MSLIFGDSVFYSLFCLTLACSLKSTGRSDPMQRSAAFWGEESDMEESEMSVPMGTMKSDDLKDDFDFYD